MNYTPGISVLAAITLTGIALLWKLDTDQLTRMASGKSLVVLSSVILFIMILILHLFQPQSWTADILKVIVGVLVGISTAYKNEDKQGIRERSGGVDATSTTFGDDARVAGRDINETIERMESEISEIKDSVLNQYSTIQKRLSSVDRYNTRRRDFLINTIYERGMNRTVNSVEEVVNRWSTEGWDLVEVTSDFTGMDGLILVFSRPSDDNRPRIEYFHGVEMEPQNLE